MGADGGRRAAHDRAGVTMQQTEDAYNYLLNYEPPPEPPPVQWGTPPADTPQPSDVGMHNRASEIESWRGGHTWFPAEEIPDKLLYYGQITPEEYSQARTVPWSYLPENDRPGVSGVYNPISYIWDAVEDARLKAYGADPRPRWPNRGPYFQRASIGIRENVPPGVSEHELRHLRYFQNLTPEERKGWEESYSANMGDQNTLTDWWTQRKQAWGGLMSIPGYEAAEAYAEFPNMPRPKQSNPSQPPWVYPYFNYMPEYRNPWWQVDPLRAR